MKKVLILIYILYGITELSAQNILLDKPVLAAALTLFPDISNPNQYYFLPNKLRLGIGESGKPQFSFLRFVQNVRTQAGEEAVREGNGGGVVHAVVELYVSDEQKKDAERELKRISKNAEAMLMGPVIYKSGTMSLVSSIANEKGGYAKSVIGLGPAPLLVGNKAAVSVLLTKDGAKILWETFKTPAPDMSFSFVMSVAGYRTPLNAKIEVDFEKIYQSESFSVGVNMKSKSISNSNRNNNQGQPQGGSTKGDDKQKKQQSDGTQGQTQGGSTQGQPQAANSDESGFYIDAELRSAFEEMRQNGDIKVTGPAMDAQGEKILEIAYGKLIDQMFEPVASGSSSTTDMNTILQIANQRNGESNPTNNTSNSQAVQETDGTKQSLGITVAYQLKKIKKSGKFTLDLNRSLSDELQFRFDENFGKLNCKECFREVNLDDPMFRQREIQVSVDGLNADQFKKFINFATISMKKTHGNNDITSDEVRVGIDDFEKKGNVYRLLYGWKDAKDANKDKWLKYEYKTTWSLFGDYTIEGEWKNSDAFGINVVPPVRPISIDVEASPDLLKAAQVRSANIKFFYNYGGGEKVEQINIRAESPITAAKVELLLPQNQYDYEYEIIWRLTGNREVKSGRLRSNSTLLYADELPN